MGLDGVELAMAVEDEFDITLTNFHAERITTVGALIDHVHAAVNGLDPITERIEMERILAEFERVTDRSIKGIPLETPVVELLNPDREVEQWRELLGLPAPEFPPGLSAMIYVVGIGVGCLGLLVSKTFSPLSAITALGLAAATMIGLRLALAHRKQIPDRSLTLQSLVWWREPAPGEITSRPTIAAKVREIVVEQLGVEPSQVVEGARFVEDLGIG